jgi:CheY-like chemotaxis protein
MLLGRRVLLVEDAQFMLEALGQILRPHFTKVVTAACYTEAVDKLERDLSIDIVISDVVLPDGNGFKLLEHIAAAPPPRPNVLLMTARWSEADHQRAMDMGAIAYLHKPISVRELRDSLTTYRMPHDREVRKRTLATAWVVDPEMRERLLSFDIHDISMSGALLDTSGPLPVGTALEFEIVRADDPEGREAVRGRGTVVRVQEPSWLNAGGSAVHFDRIESRDRLEKLVGENARTGPHIIVNPEKEAAASEKKRPAEKKSSAA